MAADNLIIVQTTDGARAFAKHWDVYCRGRNSSFPEFEELLHTVSKATGFVLLAEVRNEIPVTLACFIEEKSRVKFEVGKRSFGTFLVKQLALFGNDVLGELRPDTWLRLLRTLDKNTSYDFVNLGDITKDSDLYRVVSTLPKNYRITKLSSRDNVRWSINLPEKFDEYVTSLGPKTRQMVRQSIRKFRQSNGFVRTISDPEEVQCFLSIAEHIYRQTYQWRLGQRLQNDPTTREEFMRLARAKKLRCYVLFIDGQACAFIVGRTIGSTYHYERVGYLPNFAKSSPGKVLLMLAIKDLIQGGGHRSLDFGEGGDKEGYKSKFGNISKPSQKVLISRRLSGRPAVISLAYKVFSSLKRFARHSFQAGPLGQIRRALRG